MARETCFLNTRRALCSSIGINAILFTALLVLQYFYDIRKDDGNATEELGVHANGQLAKNYFSDFISVSDNTLCVECGYLGENISAEETLYNQILVSKNGSRMCCLEDGSLASLARKVGTYEIGSKINWCIKVDFYRKFCQEFCQENYLLYNIYIFHFRNCIFLKIG